MFSEQLDKLIEASLIDGELSEKERQVLFRRAEAEGIDLDEFEILLDAQLLAAKEAKEAKEQPQAPPTPQPVPAPQPPKNGRKKLGTVLVCPACGASVPGGVATCPECGHVFNNVEANSSATKLDERLMEIQKEYRRRKNELSQKKQSFWDTEDPEADCDSEMAKAILSFPVPNSRADLLALLPYMKTRAEASGDAYSEETRRACRAKYKECVLKAKLSFGKDPDFQFFFIEPSPLEKLWDNIRNSEFFIPIALIAGSSLGLILMGLLLGAFE